MRKIVYFFLAFSSLIHAQKNIEFELDGKKFHVSTASKLESKLDSSSFINFILNTSTSNNILSSNEILDVLSKKIKHKPDKIKVSCQKHYLCKKDFGWDMNEIWYDAFRSISDEQSNTLNEKLDRDMKYYTKLSAYRVATVFGEGEMHYGHKCKKCSTWSESYRKKTGCDVCYDEKETFCGAKVTCPLCNGSGFRYDQPEELELSLLEYLDNQKINNIKFIVFFNNPEDFGLIEIETGKKMNICINEFNVYHTPNILVISNSEKNTIIEQVKNFANEKERKNKEDRETMKIIRSLIDSNQDELAAMEYLSLHEKNIDVKNEIQTKLDFLYSNKTINLTNEKLNEFLRKNIEAINKLNTGEYSVKIDYNKNIWLNNVNRTNDFIFQYQNINLNSYFSVKTNYFTSFTIHDSIREVTMEEISKNNLKQVKWKVNSRYDKQQLVIKVKLSAAEKKENINYVNNDKYYFTDKTLAYCSKSIIVVNAKKFFIKFISTDSKNDILSFDKDIDENSIKCSFIENKVRYINKVEFSNKFDYYSWSEFNLKKYRWAKENAIITSYVSLFPGMIWGLFRASEYLSAEDGSTIN